MRRHDIVIESNGNLQVSRKQDTHYLEIKEDLRKFYSLSFKKSLFLVEKKRNGSKLVKKIKMNLNSKSLKH